MSKEKVCLINALSPDLHSGKTFKVNYGRPGHITGSKNLFAQELINKEDMTFLNARELENKFRDIGVFDSDQTIAYCGGGISATTNVFCLLLIGYSNVSLYDGSLTEWGPDNDLPMDTLI
jgi:thiosulfate/3-mercaptopyruvate sulfurtransferase